MRRMAALMFMVVVFAGCGGDDGGGSAATYADSAAVADTLTAAGLACDGFHVDPPADNADGGFTIEGVPDPVEVGKCEDAEYNIEISMYEDDVAVKRATGKAAFTAYCLFAEGFGFELDGAEMVTGANWTVSVSDPDGKSRDAGPYADALGGDVKTIDCP